MKDLIFIKLNPIDFPWNIINKTFLLKFDFYWGINSELNKTLLLKSLSETVKKNSTFIVADNPFILFLEYIQVSNYIYNRAFILNEDNYTEGKLLHLFGSEFQQEKINCILNLRPDLALLTIPCNLIILDDYQKYKIKNILKNNNIYCTIDNIKKQVNNLIYNQNIKNNFLLQQKDIPLILKEEIYAINFKDLMSFYKSFQNNLNSLSVRYLLGLYLFSINKKLKVIYFSRKEKILTVLCCHKQSNHLINFINELSKLSELLIIVNSGKKINTSLQNIKIIETENKGYDCGKWYLGLVNENYAMYDRILLVNDSIYNLRELDDTFYYVQGNPNELIGIIDSNEVRYHIQSHFRFYTVSSIQKILSFLKMCHESKLDNLSLRTHIILNFELNINLWNNFESYFSVNDINYTKNINLDVKTLKEKIENENFPICKVQTKLK